MTSRRLRAAGGSPAIGMWIKLPIVESIEIAHRAGFDFVVIDLEHSTIAVQAAAVQIAMARALGIAVLVRIPLGAAADFGRLLDAGASGLVIPHVESPADAASAVRLARFPPKGERGAGPTSRAGAWGASGIRDYLSDAEDVLLVLQLETQSAVTQARSIGEIDNVDALLLGRLDLAVSMGEDISGEAVAVLVAGLEEESRVLGLHLGTAVGRAEDVVSLPSGAYSFVVVSNDATLLASGATTTVRDARAALR